MVYIPLLFNKMKRGFLALFLFSLLGANTTSSHEGPIIGSTEWVKNKVAAYPELNWLLDKAIEHTQIQEEQKEIIPLSWSNKISGRYYPEFERTMLSIVNLHLLYKGDDSTYEHFITPQLASTDALIVKLSGESFKKLHNFTLSVIKDDLGLLTALEVILFLDDLGRTPIAHHNAKRYGVSEYDHHMFIQTCLKKCPQIFPSFLALPTSCQDLIKSSAALLHFGHLSHIEGGPEILTKLKASGILDNNPRGFDFQLLIYICEMSAVYGHIDNRGSKNLTENVFQTVEAIQNTIHYLATHNEAETLEFYLAIRGKWLGLDNENPNTRLLSRLGAMMRLLKPEDGEILADAYEEISEEHKKVIESELDPGVYREERTATYMPAVMANLYQAYGAQALFHPESLKKAIQKGTIFIAQFLNMYRNNKANLAYDPSIILNFNLVARQVRTHPELIEKGHYLINEGGIITLN